MENITYPIDGKTIQTEDWTGYLVQPKKEWLNPNELQLPHVVLEDRGPRVLIQLLPEYQAKHYPNLTFPSVESGMKEWYEVIDKEIKEN